MNLKDRTRWAINYISAKYKLSNPKIAKRMGIKNDTVNSYRAKLSNPKVDFIVKFCDEFDIDLIWFTKGDGEPFPGASMKYPEVCSQASYEIARHKDRGSAEAVPSGLAPALETGNEDMENPTERSFRRLGELAGISIERGWKKNLAAFLSIPAGQISNSILRGKISRNLVDAVEEKGFAREKWLVSDEADKTATPQSQTAAVDVEMSFQKLAVIAGIKIGQNWLFDLASFIDIEPLEIRKSIGNDGIDEEMLQGIESKGFDRRLWVVKREAAADSLLSRKQPVKTSDLLEMTAHILRSDTSYATAFALNIEAFYKAVISEK